MDLRQEKLMEMRQEMLETQYHERMMVESSEYFEEYMIEKQIFGTLTLLDIKEQINKICAEYRQNENDLLDRLKEI